MTKPFVIFERDLPGNSVLTREYLLEVLSIVIDEALRKTTTRQTPSNQKPAYARILIQAVTAAANILKDEDLLSLESRLAVLEKEVNIKWTK